jgi:hypothetical protein
MSMLLVNAGSSSLKISIAVDGEVIYGRSLATSVSAMTDAEWEPLLAEFTAVADDIDVVVHRSPTAGGSSARRPSSTTGSWRVSRAHRSRAAAPAALGGDPGAAASDAARGDADRLL